MGYNDKENYKVRLDNVIGTPINPATEETLQEIVDNSTSQVTVEEALQELVSRLSFLPSVRGIAADLRVTLLSGTVTTVTNVTNLVNMGGHTAAQLIPHTTNQVAILSNINNCII